MEDALIESLKDEEKNFKEDSIYKKFVPIGNFYILKNIKIEIEKSWIGSNIGYLLRCLQGTDLVTLYSLVSYRVVSRIADIL